MRERQEDTDENDEELDERVEALFDLLAAAGSSSSTNNAELEEFARVLEGFGMDDLPDEAQPYDRPVERLIAVLETCRSMEDDDLNQVRTKKPEPTKRRSASRSNSKKRISATIPEDKPTSSSRATSATTNTTEPLSPADSANMALQAQFDKEYNSTAYPKIGPGYSDTISVVSDLTTPTVMTNRTVPEEEADYHAYYHGKPMLEAPRFSRAELGLRPPSSRSLTLRNQRLMGGGGAARQRRMNHQAALGRLGGGERPSSIRKIPESRPVRNYPSLRESPNAFPSVFPSDDLSSSLPRSPRQFETKRLLKKSDGATSKQPLRSSSRSKRSSSSGKLRKCTDGKRDKVDAGGVLNNIGQDIDYIFQELSVLEEDVPPPVENDESVVSESNLSSTAKIKYALGSVARSLKDDEEPKDRRSDLAPADSNRSPSSSVTPKSDPLIIDEDGFIIHDNGEDPFQNEGANSPPPLPQLSKQKKTAAAPFEDTFFGAKKEKPKEDRKRSSSRSNSSKRRESLSKGASSGSLKGRTSRGGSRSRSSRGSRNSNPSKSSETTAVHGNGKEKSRIDGVEAATKQRIDMLRKMVEESEQNDGNGNSSAAIASKLDLVEAETMKQIARLRDRLGDGGEQQLVT